MSDSGGSQKKKQSQTPPSQKKAGNQPSNIPAKASTPSPTPKKKQNRSSKGGSSAKKPTTQPTQRGCFGCGWPVCLAIAAVVLAVALAVVFPMTLKAGAKVVAIRGFTTILSVDSAKVTKALKNISPALSLGPQPVSSEGKHPVVVVFQHLDVSNLLISQLSSHSKQSLSLFLYFRFLCPFLPCFLFLIGALTLHKE